MRSTDTIIEGWGGLTMEGDGGTILCSGKGVI